MTWLLLLISLVKIMETNYKNMAGLIGNTRCGKTADQLAKRWLQRRFFVLCAFALTALAACGGQEQEEVAPATSILTEIGLEVTPAENSELAIGGPIDDGSQISCVLAGSGIYISELRRNNPDLEGVFLSLTGGIDGESTSA